MADAYLGVPKEDDDDLDEDDEFNYNLPISSNNIVNEPNLFNLAAAKSAYSVPIADNQDIDRVERVLKHILYCCEQQEGFDCYQVLYTMCVFLHNFISEENNNFYS